MKYAIVIEETPNNYAAYAPDLPGCVATADTREEAIRLMREGIPFHIEDLREDANHTAHFGGQNEEKLTQELAKSKS